MEVLLQKLLLALGERASHEGDNARQSAWGTLRDREPSTTTTVALIHGPVQIEEDE